MNILYLLIPIGVVVLAAAIWLFIWAVRSGQYEDLEGPAYRILMDDDDPMIPGNEPSKDEVKQNKQGDDRQDDN